MKKVKHTIGALVLIAILAPLLLKSLKTPKESPNKTNHEKTSQQLNSTNTHPKNPTVFETKLKRDNQAESNALRKIEKEFDEILPAQFPNQPSTLCDVNLKPGESLIVGGFENQDGGFEFTKLSVNPANPELSSDFYKIKTMSFTLNREKSTELGLGLLISPAKTRIQKSITIQEDISKSIQNSAAHAIAYPSLTSSSGQPGTISVGTEEYGQAISFLPTAAEEQGSIRLRMRLEHNSNKEFR
ncbi:MAG: hypothetical protein AB8D78_00275 [Akkermansiaceae bacterium]